MKRLLFMCVLLLIGCGCWGNHEGDTGPGFIRSLDSRQHYFIFEYPDGALWTFQSWCDGVTPPLWQGMEVKNIHYRWVGISECYVFERVERVKK